MTQSRLYSAGVGAPALTAVSLGRESRRDPNIRASSHPKSVSQRRQRNPAFTTISMRRDSYDTVMRWGLHLQVGTAMVPPPPLLLPRCKCQPTPPAAVV
jgi:hypothetical protein